MFVAAEDQVGPRRRPAAHRTRMPEQQVAAIRDARTQEAQSQNALQSAAVAGDAAQSLAKAAAMAGIPGGQLLGSM